MRRLSEKNKQVILRSINEYFDETGRVPSVREIAAGAGMAATTVHRYLCAMKESGELEYGGRRRIETARTEKEKGQCAMPVLRRLPCGPCEDEEENIIEYIRMPETLVGRGEFFALIAEDDSLTESGIFPGDVVIVRKQEDAQIGDLVVASQGGAVCKLKRLCLDEETQRVFLRSDKSERGKDTPVSAEELRIQGVAVCTVHNIGVLRK